jgi:hypothetical protein
VPAPPAPSAAPALPAASATVERLAWTDPEIGTIALPRAPLILRTGLGSGLTRRQGDPPGHVWAVGDRGPNIKVKDAIALYGLHRLAPLRSVPGCKIMPRPDIGPEIAELRVVDGRVELLRAIRLAAPGGSLISGFSVPPGGGMLSEPVYDLDGTRLASDPGGLDTEGIAALPDGGFWLGDEFGPSLVRIDADGTVLRRVVPEGVVLDAPYPVEASLPAIAAKRQLNRGFEALALTPDGTALFLAFQSPLAHPDEAAHEQAAHVRLWRLDPASAAVEAQYLYPLDPPESFRRDCAKGEFERKDVKVSEIASLGGGALLVLERGSQTTKIYRVELGDPLPPEHLDIAARPTVEELSGAGGPFPLAILAKQLLFSTDLFPEVAADLEGMAILSEHELLLVNDNDFGVEGAETSFWRVRFDAPVLRVSPA